MSTIGLKVHLIPSAVASSAEIASSLLTAAGSQELASAIGTGKIVLYPWMTSREKMTGMCSRDCRAACCTWLMLATPTRSSTEPTWPLRTSSSSVCPGVPFAPVGPDISSCPNFSASVIFPIRASTFPEIALSRCCAAPGAAPLAGFAGLAPAAGTATRSAAAASGATSKPVRARTSRRNEYPIVPILST